MFNDARKKFYFIIGLYVATVLVFSGAVYFLISEINKNSGEYQVVSAAILNLEEERNNLKRNEGIIAQIEGDISQIQAAYLKEREIPGFIATMEKIADSMGAKFKIEYIPEASLPPAASGQAQSKGEQAGLNFRISLDGSFANFLKFVANLENNPFPPYRLVEIKNLDIRRLEIQSQVVPQPQGLKTGDVSGIIYIKIYTQ